MAIITQPSPPPLHERPRRSRGLIVGALVAAVLVVAGIIVAVVALRGDKATTGTVEATGPGVSTAARAPKSDQEKIIDVYLAYSKAEIEAQENSDPDSPLIAAYVTDPQLTAAVNALRQLKEQGLATRAPANSISHERVTVDSIDGDRASITVCSVDDGYLVQADSGQMVYPGSDSTGTTLFLGGMVREPGGVWKVATMTRKQKWTGVAGCAVGQ